ncbi:class IIb bacteriocin, lactobin A/cerein 7B family [Senegalia sp. (in: firmicutes)]|uniref:class IIb bacteriocin, lactobin A/cerein 7B family n=1 Tax=Senegalia sp. (in: firmicutes) TaxID=1924098 RepID=UPI003F9DC36C
MTSVIYDETMFQALSQDEMVNVDGGISVYALSGMALGSVLGAAFAASFGLVGFPLVFAIYSAGLSGAVWGIPAGVVAEALYGPGV